MPEDYYEQPLEFRRACLQAASIDHLCKSIIMENTRAHPSVQGWQDPNNSKYYVVIVQVCVRRAVSRQGQSGAGCWRVRPFLCGRIVKVSDRLSGDLSQVCYRQAGRGL